MAGGSDFGIRGLLKNGRRRESRREVKRRYPAFLLAGLPITSRINGERIRGAMQNEQIVRMGNTVPFLSNFS